MLFNVGILAFASLLAVSAHAGDENEKKEIVEAVTEAVTRVADSAEKQESSEEASLSAVAHRPDELLADVLIKSYQTNPELKAQYESFQGTVEEVPQALAGALPSLNAAYSKGRRRTQSNGASWSYSDSETKSLVATQPLFRGGSTYANTKAARREVDAALARFKQVEQSVLLQAVTAYMDVVEAKSVLELSEKNRAVLAEQKRAASQRFEVGEDTRTDVAQAESRLALAESEVIRSKGRLRSARAVYEEVVGEIPESFDIPKVSEIEGSLDALKARALVNSPVVKEAESLMASADYIVDSNIGSLLPSVDIEASLSRQDGVGTFGTNEFDQDEIAITASMPIYSGGQNHSFIRQAKQAYQQQRFQLLDVRDQVRRQTVSAWEDLQTASATIKSNQLAVKSANIALKGARQEKQYGARTTLDVLDAERELFNAKVQVVRAKRDKVVASYSLLAILGELTANNMQLDVTVYDPEEYYSDKEYQFIGF